MSVKKRKIKLSIIIPVYNERNTVGLLLQNVYNVPLEGINKEIIIIEDNSQDGSRRIVREFAKKHKAVKLILRKRPMGKGSAVIEGLKIMSGEIVLIQDADLEYDVADYPKLLRPILANKAHFVLGSRHLKHNGRTDWLIRRFTGRDRIIAHFMNFGGVVFHRFFNLIYGTKLTDPTTMYKVFRAKLLHEISLSGKYFELDWEIVCKFVRKGYYPVEVPVKYVSRGFNEGKKVNFWRDVHRWITMIIKVRLLPLDRL